LSDGTELSPDLSPDHARDFHGNRRDVAKHQ
jgi:hypothetical protein